MSVVFHHRFSDLCQSPCQTGQTVLSMRAILRILTCLLILASCTSCLTSRAVSHSRSHQNSIDSKRTTLSGKTFQRLSRHAALASTTQGDVVCIIDDFTDYYDGMRIKNRYKRYGTFEYRSYDGIIHYAPIFVRLKDFKKYRIIAEELQSTDARGRRKPSGIGI